MQQNRAFDVEQILKQVRHLRIRYPYSSRIEMVERLLVQERDELMRFDNPTAVVIDRLADKIRDERGRYEQGN